MARRPQRPRPVEVRNTGPTAVTYDSDGRIVAGFGSTVADETDPVTAARITDRTLHVIPKENA